MKFQSLTARLYSGKPLLAVLVDPDKFNADLVRMAASCRVSCFLVGGSELRNGDTHKTVKAIKNISRIPVVLFPGDESQLTPLADGLLLLSLLSGRNPEYLIGKHVRAAPIIRKMKIPHLPVAYMLVGGNSGSATQRVTGTEPIEGSDLKTIMNTAIAAEQLGFRAIYLEGGSGTSQPVRPAVIRMIKKTVSLPLIVGGGLSTPARVAAAARAGASMVVIGNALEANGSMLPLLSKAFYSAAK